MNAACGPRATQIGGALLDPTEALVNRALAAAQAAVAKGEPQGPALLQQVRAWPSKAPEPCLG